MSNASIIKIVGIFILASTGILADEASTALPYSEFNSPNIIDINGEKFRLWNEPIYLDEQVIIVEHWGEWLKEGTERDFIIRILVEEHSSGSQWDTGFFSGVFETVLNERDQKVLIVQKSSQIEEFETKDTAISYLIDVHDHEIDEIRHPRGAIAGGFDTNSNIWLDIKSFDYESGSYNVERVFIPIE